MTNTYKISVGNPQENRLHGRPGINGKDNIKIYLKTKGCEAVD
jgi:hypothetical protein